MEDSNKASGVAKISFGSLCWLVWLVFLILKCTNVLPPEFTWFWVWFPFWLPFALIGAITLICVVFVVIYGAIVDRD